MSQHSVAVNGFLSVHPSRNARDLHPSMLVAGHIKTPMRNLHDVAFVMLNYSWSTVIWKDGHARNANYVESWGIPLDVDNGASLREAREKLTPYRHVIATTKNHQLDKKGIVADRFRIFLQTDRVILTAPEFSATVRYWCNLLCADPCGASPSQHYKPAALLISVQETGQFIPIELPPPPRKQHGHIEGRNPDVTELELCAANIMLGFNKYGGRNRASYIAAHRLKQALKSERYAVDFISGLTDLPLNEIQQSVRSAYGNC